MLRRAMKQKVLPLIAMASVLTLAACALDGPSQGTDTSSDKLSELPARFQGQLPCADCSGIRYVLALYSNHAYTLERRYLGTPEQYSRHFEMGQWATNDAAHNKLTLTPTGDSQSSQWRIAGADRLTALSGDGHAIESELNHTLKRTGEPVTPSLTDTYWDLVRLDGEPVDGQTEASEPHVVLHRDSGRVAGATGCNRLSGEYSHHDDSLRFAKLASTKMACPRPAMQTEQAFATMLDNVRSYQIRSDHLVVYDATHTPIAVFRAKAMH